MNLPFKPHYIALVCSAGLLAAAGTLYVKSREPAAPEAPPVAAVAAPEAAATPTYSTAQITQWVAPIALYPDPLLSQVLMASTYPDSVTQAVQWSKDHPGQQGDAAVKAVAGQPWDASVKSLVAFPQLTGMMGKILNGLLTSATPSWRSRRMSWMQCKSSASWRSRQVR